MTGPLSGCSATAVLSSASRIGGGARLILFGWVFALLAGCVSAPESSVPPASPTTGTVSETPAATATATATATAEPPAARLLSPAALAEAMRFRRDVGLRSDEAWIRRVATDPAAEPGIAAYGVPLTPEERDELDARDANADAVGSVVRGYGLGHPDVWAGMYIDQPGSGAIVAQFTDDVGTHEAAIRRLVGPLARLEVHEARWTVRELEALKDRIQDSAAWLATIGVRNAWPGVDDSENLVVVRLQTNNQDAPALIEEHFDADGMLRFRVLSSLVWEGGHGNLRVHAVYPNGQPVPGRARDELDCLPVPDMPAATVGGAWGFDDEGVCRIPDVAATSYEVQAKRRVEGEWVIVGRGRVAVPAGGEGVVRIVVTPP